MSLKIVLADRDLADVSTIAKDLNAKSGHDDAILPVQVDIEDWESQRVAFEAAVQTFGGRVDYVFAIAEAPEGQWLGAEPKSGTAFHKPDLSAFYTDAYGPLYTSGLAIQQFRRQDPNKYGFRGKLIIVSSSLGFYNVPTLPIYTAAKHCVVGFARTFGRYLPRENITLNTVCPNPYGGPASASEIQFVTDAFESLMGPSEASGDAVEILPGSGGYRVKEIPVFTNEVAHESIKLATAPEHRAWQFHAPVEE
ncbi:hypothetical protein Sste5346_005308 [Sporothrix stenoceras]|uniref:Uncharacterized protein n=1 Tax=Sporothrix stenoceras TaxID=5173 RepID=A0ABR3Z5I3_9PEZI